MLNEPVRNLIFEIEDVLDEAKPRRFTDSAEDAQTEYNNGSIVIINEVVSSELSTRQTVATVIKTNWTETRGVYGY
ncbi:hypothetical protein FACS189427_05730 [Planctomycetales bacterium]|nr:hypothetical protein FACS1894214_3590 [Planctomycetales bacterium]GHT35738.1 hypothetical protein FACS189427_05730 [Planctomycetales bacterium]